MKIISSYIETLQFTCDILFDDAINNVNDIFNGLSNAIDKIGALDVRLLMAESIQPEAGTMWKKLMGINQMKCERLNKMPFSDVTLEKLKYRLNVIYERFPLIRHIDNMSEGAHGRVVDLIFKDFELLKLLLKSNVDGSNLTFTKCKDVVDMFMDKQIEFQNLYSEIEQQSNIQRQMQKEQQAHSTDADEPQRPEILKHPEITKEFDKAIQIGLLLDYYTLNPDKKKAPKWLLACFCWGICKQYDISTKAKSGKNKGGFAADWKTFDFIKDKNGKEIDLKQGWQNTKNKNYDPQKLKGFTFWEALCKELDISE